MSDGKITATLKAGTGFDAPWVVVGGDSAGEIRDTLGAIEQSGLLVDVARVAKAFQNYAVVGGTLGAKPVDAPNAGQHTQQAAPQPEQAQQGWGAAPTQQQQPQQAAQPQGGPRIVKDNFGSEWEYDVPGAPVTPRGPAIVKRGVNQKNGKMWRKWNDPAAGPEWFAARNPKVPTADRWQGEFID